MNEQLNQLIELAIADGVVTDKERAVLYKKADEFGVDKDELDLIIDGKLHQKQQEIAKQSTQKTTTQKHGDFKKCPSCGAPVNAFSTKCSDCGHEFTGIDANKTIKAIFDKLDSIEKERDTIKLEGGYIDKIFRDENQKQQEIDEIIRKKRSAIIRDFPIPNAREELLELLHFIHPKITNTANPDMNFYDWKTKFNEILSRAKVAYSSDSKKLAELHYYESNTKGNIFTYYKQLDKKTKSFVGALIGLVVFLCVMVPFFVSMSNSHDKGVEKEKERLEVLMNKVNDAISKKDYESALMLSAQLKWEYSDSYSSTDTKELVKSWDEKREKLIEIIDKEKNTTNKNK